MIYLSPYIRISYPYEGAKITDMWARFQPGKPMVAYNDFCHVAECGGQWLCAEGSVSTFEEAQVITDKYLIDNHHDIVFLTQEQWDKLQVLI